MTINLHVNGNPVEVPDGATILDAVLTSNIDLPHLCKPDSRSPLGACRTCLIEVDGSPRLVAACHTPASESQSILTDSSKSQRIRTGVLDLTLGMSSDGKGKGLAAQHARTHLLTESTFSPLPRISEDDTNPFFSLTMADCILCGRCIDACQKTQHIGAIGINGRGRNGVIGSAFESDWEDSTCTSCGQCVSQCPTGALLPATKHSPRANAVTMALPIITSTDETTDEKKQYQTAVGTTVTETTCPYCGVGCGLRVHTDKENIVWVDGVPENNSSLGMTCVKGRFGLDYVNSKERLTQPLIRKNGKLQPASWDEALNLVADKFAGVVSVDAKSPTQKFGGIASAKATNEDGYVMQKFVRSVMGTNSIDHCSRLCHAPSVVALMEQIGSGATSNSYEDYENAGTLLVVGSDTGRNHPVVASRIRRNIENNNASLIVVNPIRIDLCDVAEIHLQPRPGTDVTLFNAMAKVILDEGLENQDFIDNRTEGFEEWKEVVDKIDLSESEKITGVPAEDISKAARLYAQPRPNSNGTDRGSCLIWGMGVTQHTNGSDNARSLINLALSSGQVGKSGNGISPLRGQNNVQGCSDSGCLPNIFPGYEPVGGETHDKWETAWEAEIPHTPGLQSTLMIDKMMSSELTTMYIVGENPLVSDPYLIHAREAFNRLDFLVVQDLFLHETAQIADVVLPAASFAEKTGTFTNSERRVQLIRPFMENVGQSRNDWEITTDIARRVLERLERPVHQFTYSDSSEIFDEMASLTPIISGLSHSRLNKEGGIQWPCPDDNHPGTKILFDEDFPRGRGLFMPVVQTASAAELPSRRYPFTLITGRSLYHWHTGAITREVPNLMKKVPVVTVDINPADANEMNIHDGQDIQISSRRGEIIARVHVVDKMQRGDLFVPFVALEGVAANILTNDALDLPSGIPEYKACAVRLDTPGSARKVRKNDPKIN